MKKLTILILSIVMSSVTAFAQWDVNVKWDASSANCECNASIGSKYVVNLRIIDVANGNTVVYNNSVFVDPNDTEHLFDVETEVKGHCDDPNINNIPNYTIYTYVGFWCAETTPPELICSGTNTLYDKSCLSFSNSQQTITVELQ
jgi:hypothetical protein